jgi:hypothetical protein
MFWAIDMILTNSWKIYESLYGPFLSSTQKRHPGAHREFLEALVELIFLYNSEEYAETAPGTFFKEYPKYSYLPHKLGPKLQFLKSLSPNLADISRKTPFIFKGDSGRPRASIPTKILLISQHQHIKTTIKGWCLVCRNPKRIQIAQIAKKESIVYGTIFKVSGETLEEVLPPLQETLKGPKRIRGRHTRYKCSECAIPICGPGMPCWEIVHKRLLNK